MKSMIVMNHKNDLAAAAARELGVRGMHDRTVLPENEGYDQRCRIFNGAVTSRPALFVRCESREDVKVAVRVARKHGMPLSVRAGGHDWAGRALRHNGLVIDLTRMRQVDVNPEAQTAMVAGGATTMDLLGAAAQFGLTAVTSAVSSVGVIGATLGGGYGPFSPKYGLAIDNLLEAEIVLADGQLVTAHADENPELFWALRGGGGNFGVVTAIRVRLHRLEKVLAGVIVFPWSEAAVVLPAYSNFVMSSPDELATIPALAPGPDGALSMLVATIWCGEQRQGEQEVLRLQRLGKPSMMQVAEVTCQEVLAMFEGTLFAQGRHYDVQTRSLPRLTPEVAAALVEAMEMRTSPFSVVAWHHCHGAPTRVSPGATSFGIRQQHFMMDIVAAWDSDSGDDVAAAAHRQWARDLSQDLAPMSLPGGIQI
jgi:hypothetical protein